MEDLLNIKEAASYLRLNSMTVYRLVQQGMLPAFKVGGNWRFQKEILDNWMREKASAKRVSTLIVDDDPMIREILSQMIKDHHCTVADVESGEKAVELVARKHFDIIFLDLKMPGLGGIETMRTIKQMDREIVVVIVTGYADEPIASEAMSMGPLVLIRKPFKEEDIVKVLQLVSKGKGK